MSKMLWIKLVFLHTHLFSNHKILIAAKLEKSDATNSSKAGGETAKLAVLTKAIDSIQDNSKSLEMMGL